MELNHQGLFKQNQLADRIALLAVYMPFVRREILSFVNVWNMHRIRKQSNRPQSITGKPFMLYFYPSQGIQDFKVQPDETLVQSLLDQNSSGNYYQHFFFVR